MGIKHLNKILQATDNAIIRIDSLEEISGGRPTVIAVDASLYCYKFACSPAGDPIRLLTQQIARLHRAKLFPVYVFDGRAPQEKEAVLLRRQRKRKNTRLLPHHFMREMRAVLMELGVPVVVPEGEGDAACAALYKMGLVNACLTDDLDILVHGCGAVVRQEKDRISLYRIEKILQELKMTEDDFVRTCISIGCDYNKGVDFEKANTLMRRRCCGEEEIERPLPWSEASEAALAIYRGDTPMMSLIWDSGPLRSLCDVNTDLLGDAVTYSDVARIIRKSTGNPIYFPLREQIV
jgi:hypothetical protein